MLVIQIGFIFMCSDGISVHCVLALTKVFYFCGFDMLC